jgi:hypothetical protein
LHDHHPRSDQEAVQVSIVNGVWAGWGPAVIVIGGLFIVVGGIIGALQVLWSRAEKRDGK